MKCPVCSAHLKRNAKGVRGPGGWDWDNNRLIIWCSIRHRDWWQMQYPHAQAAVTQVEIEAVEASLSDVGRVVAEIGAIKPVNDYTRDEVLRLIFTCVRAYRKNFEDQLKAEEIPY